MRHDPERTAAAYLASELSATRRFCFERHMLECDRCWAEANAGREGRMLAEALREVAPARVRERIRAFADLPDPPRPRRPRLVIAVALALLIGVVLGLPHGQPASLTAAADLLRSDSLPVSARPAPPVPRIGTYGWRGTFSRSLGGSPATIYSYADGKGRRILVIASPRTFPRSPSARDVEPAPNWLASVNGASLLCADREGLSWLAVAGDDATALAAGRALGLG